MRDLSTKETIQFFVARDTDAPFEAADSYLQLDAALAQELLEWLGYGPERFGSMPASDLAARCRRRLWPMPRNMDPAKNGRPEGTLRDLTERLLRMAAQASAEDDVMFG